MNYLSRICINSNNWAAPTGEASKVEVNSFCSNFGYGHEEWLFRFDWQIGGWQYGFLQGVNNSRSKFAGSPEPINVTLFTCEPGNRRRYVAHISDLECLSHAQSSAALKVYEQRGWLALMHKEILDIDGDVSALGSSDWVDGVINVRFRIDCVDWFPRGTYADDNEFVKRVKHYQLNRVADNTTPYTSIGLIDPSAQNLPMGRTTPPNQNPYFRSGTCGKLISPEHNMIQVKLWDELRAEYPNDKLTYEKHYIDIVLETDEEMILYEVKSDLLSRTVLRLAIGQLLEYGFYRGVKSDKRIKLVAVGRNPLDKNGKEYLELLKNRFHIPLEYRVVSL